MSNETPEVEGAAGPNSAVEAEANVDRSPDAESGRGHARETDVQESDPNADSSVGLAGGMGVSSERVGSLRGAAEAGTYGTEDPFPSLPETEAPPEQSADPATGPEVTPAQPPLKDHGPRIEP